MSGSIDTNSDIPSVVAISNPDRSTLPKFLKAVPRPAATKSSILIRNAEVSMIAPGIHERNPTSAFQLFSGLRSSPPVSTFCPKLVTFKAPLEGAV